MRRSTRRRSISITRPEELEGRFCLAFASIGGGREIVESGGSVPIEVRLSERVTEQASVRLSVVGSSALAGDDYRLSSVSPAGLVVFAPGETVKTVNVLIRNDVLRESRETVRLSIDSSVNCVVGEASSTTVTILDDDSYSVSLLGPSGTVRPGSGAGFTIQLSSPATKPETFRIVTSDETAIAEADYKPLLGRPITIPRGATSARFVVQTIPGVAVEPEETFLVRVTPTSIDTPFPEPVQVTIGRNPTPPPAVSVSDVSVSEGDAGTKQASFVVSLSDPHSLPVTVAYETADGSAAAADGDYQPIRGTLTFDPGEVRKAVAVDIVGDTAFELDESFRLVLSNPTAATLGRVAAVGTILNDDPSPPIPSISISDASVTEGNAGATFAEFTVTLSSAFVVPVSVGFGTRTGTAGANDFVALQGRLTFDPGQTSKPVRVQVFADRTYEPDETFEVRLFDPIRGTLARAIGEGTIVNDDPPPPQPSISIADGSVLEGNAGTTTLGFVVTLSNAYYQPVTVQYATVDGTAGVADGDYQAASGTLTFEPGQTRRMVNVLVTGDTRVEPDETFSVVLSSPTLSSLVRSTATGTIRNDDSPLPSVSVADASVDEGNTGTRSLAFVITLSAASSQAVTVQYSTADGSATTVDNDYQSANGTLTFAPGQTSQTLNVAIIGDTTVETDETLTFTLSSPSNAVIARSTATGMIRNDDTTAAPSAFTIDVVFPDNSLTTSQKAAFSQAAARWSQIIVGDLPDVTVNGQVIDDIRITAVGESIDGAYGVLGIGGPSWTSGDPRPPSQGQMKFDTADLSRMETDGTLIPVILHEMGHALGLGTMWSYRNLMGGGGYTGANALREYRTIFNLPSATFIPTAGSGHWSESVFKTELMTPIAEQPGTPMPISRITIGSLQDLGYTVNYAAADAYAAPAAVQSAARSSAMALQRAIWTALAAEASMTSESRKLFRPNRSPASMG